jgi:hypothetical protein
MKVIANALGKWVASDGSRYDIRCTEPVVMDPVLRKARRQAFTAECIAAGYTRQPLTEIETLRLLKKQEIASARYNTEMGGFRQSPEDGGLFIHTDSRTRVLLLAAITNGASDPTYVVHNWKTKEGTFITLDLSQINTIYQAVNVFIEAQFAKEASLCVLIDAATTESEIDSITW